jgi:8-oxo-dGTP diphosphatase
LEKNQISHRGQVVNQLKYFLVRNFGVKQIVVATALIVRDHKLLLTKRRDHRPEFNNRWEFPGGVVDNGENTADTVVREAKEETGLNVKIIAPIPQIYSKLEAKYSYQVFLINYLCRASSGPVVLADNEICEYGWFTLTEAVKLNFLPLNTQILKDNFKLLKKYVRY